MDTHRLVFGTYKWKWKTRSFSDTFEVFRNCIFVRSFCFVFIWFVWFWRMIPHWNCEIHIFYFRYMPLNQMKTIQKDTNYVWWNAKSNQIKWEQNKSKAITEKYTSTNVQTCGYLIYTFCFEFSRQSFYFVIVHPTQNIPIWFIR